MRKLNKALDIKKKRLLNMGIILFCGGVLLLAIGFIGMSGAGSKGNGFAGFIAIGLLLAVFGILMVIITGILLARKKDYQKMLGLATTEQLNELIGDLEKTTYEKGLLWLGENNAYLLGKKAQNMVVPYDNISSVQYQVTQWRYGFLIPLFKEHALKFFGQDNEVLALVPIRRKDLADIEAILENKNIECFF